MNGKIIHRGINAGNSPQHEEAMIAGFLLILRPLLAC